MVEDFSLTCRAEAVKWPPIDMHLLALHNPLSMQVKCAVNCA